MTWDEHVFELTLPRSVCVGHVDLKFSLHAQCSMPPNIQFTLLKQNASGIGKMPDSSMDVDTSIDFNISPDSNLKIGGYILIIVIFIVYLTSYASGIFN